MKLFSGEMKKNTIYIFGNPLLDFDNLPLKLAPKLQKIFPEINFIITDPNENLRPINQEIVIIDTIEGIDKVVILDNLNQLKTDREYSLHDFDLAFNLKLLQKIGKLKKIKIIGVPMKIKSNTALSQLEKAIKNLQKTKKGYFSAPNIV